MNNSFGPVIRDTREKRGKGWFFEEDLYCQGTVIKKLATGDYGLVGLEDKFTIDRKGKLTEFASNLTQNRFIKELERMSHMDRAIVMLEFEYEAFEGWPHTAGLVKSQIAKVRTSAKFLRKRMHEFEDLYGVEFIFAGYDGQELAYKIFQEVANGKKNT